MLEIKEQTSLNNDSHLKNFEIKDLHEKSGITAQTESAIYKISNIKNEIGVDAIVNCDLKYGQHFVEIRAKDIQDQIISILGFASKKEPTAIGFEIIKTALVAAIIGKFRRSIAVNLNFELDPRSFEFINHLNIDIIGSLEDSNTPIVTINKFTKLETNPTVTLQNDVMIGISGGRDSFVSGEILRDCGFNLHRFKIDYDIKEPNSEYSTYEFNMNGNDHYADYEPFDIPLTYYAPLWTIRDRFPHYIALGFSFDILGFDSNQRKAPYESPASLRLHQQYLDALLGKSVRFIYPIATLSTYSVFEYIRRHFGLKSLESLLSCWNRSKNSDCGYCDKCQRIKLASTAMHMTGYEYLKGMPQVIEDHAYLLGNPSYTKLVEHYGIDSLAESQLFSSKLPFNELIVEHIARTFSKKFLQIDDGQYTSNEPIHFNHDIQLMSERLGIHYDDLPKERINDITIRMPYEHYFERNIPVLAAHGEIPFYTDDVGWSYKRICDGARLEVPDSLLFRHFFNGIKYE